MPTIRFSPKLVVNWSGGSMTFYPDANPEVTSVDGQVYHEGLGLGLTWAALIAAAGTTVSHDGASFSMHIVFQSADGYRRCHRGIFLFDTSALPDGITITSATFSVYGTSKSRSGAVITPNINVYSSAPASNTNIVAGDYDSFGSTAFSDTPIDYDAWSITGYNDFTLNAAGIAAISLTGITKLGLRNANYDVAATEPYPGETGAHSVTMSCYTADQGLIAGGAAYPTNPLIRPSGIVRTFWAGIGGQSVYQTQLLLGGISPNYVSPFSKRQPESAVAPKETPSGAGYTEADFQRWLMSGIEPGNIIAIFGHFPTYDEWLAKKIAGVEGV